MYIGLKLKPERLDSNTNGMNRDDDCLMFAAFRWYCDWDGTSDEHNNYKFVQIPVQDFKVYVVVSYAASKQSFVVRMFLPDGVETASKYTVKITISPQTSRHLIYQGPVLSIEDLPDIDSSQAYHKYWFISKDVIMPFITTKTGADCSTFDISFAVYEVK